MKKTIVIFLTLISLNSLAQTEDKYPQLISSTKLVEGTVESVTQSFSEFSKSMESVFNELTFFMELDMKILTPLTSIKNHKKIEGNILESLTNGSFIYVDSVNYYPINKDSLYIKIYSQNKKFACQNSYRICINENAKNKDSFKFNMKMKVDGKNEDIENIKGDSFDYKIVQKEYKDELNYNTIEILKTYR